ncbi:MAG: hypothetical protein HZB82_07505 [Deltaproteobacteria bacterium]|nr:hypothetical protein [Deltaproteobacteria bacterium]
MRAIKFLLAFAVCLGFLAPGKSFAAQASKAALKTGDVKWTISVKPLTGMVNLYLKESGSGKDVRNAKVMAVITLPGGEKVEKEMMKMTMRQKIKGKVIRKGIYYMFSLDMSAKGAYIFDITVKAGKRDIQINARYEVK